MLSISLQIDVLHFLNAILKGGVKLGDTFFQKEWYSGQDQVRIKLRGSQNRGGGKGVIPIIVVGTL